MDGHDRRLDAGGGSRPGENDAPAVGAPVGQPAAERLDPASELGGTDKVAHDKARAAPEEGLIEDIVRLFDDGVTYGQAEIAFQKTRAKLAGRAAGVAALCVAVALILVHIALLALAVGLVMALAPLVTIWGAIAIVVGVILIGAVWLLAKARSKAGKISALFSSETEA